jgi:hypothetical protein
VAHVGVLVLRNRKRLSMTQDRQSTHAAYIRTLPRITPGKRRRILHQDWDLGSGLPEPCRLSRSNFVMENLMYVQFNELLSWRALEEKDQWDHAENDAAKHAELVHVREQHRLALHGVVKVRQGKVAMICDIA